MAEASAESAVVDAQPNNDASQEAVIESPPSERPAQTLTPEALAEMKKSAHLKFDEAAKLRKEAQAMKAEAEKMRSEVMSSRQEMERFIELSQQDPRALEKIYGPEVARKIAEDLLYNLYEEQKLSPEEKEARAKRAAEEAELKELREERKKRLEAEEKQKRDALVNEQAQHVDELIAKAIKDYNLSPTPRIVKRIAEYLEARLESGEELNVEGLVPKVHEELHQDVVNYIKDMPIEQFVEEFPSQIKKLREYDLRQSASVPSFQSGFTKPQTENSERKPKKPMNIDQFFKTLG